jgi:NAD-dependent deacetylase
MANNLSDGKIDPLVKELALYIKQSKNIVVFTGAGISTESGISDYRSKGGLWQRFQPVTIQEFLASEEKRIEYWQTKLELYESFKTAQPNDGHLSIFRLEQLNKLKAIITQNIDRLHHLAGNSVDKIFELHGNNRETICLSCKDITDWTHVYERLQNKEKAPRCLKCKGLLKPNTISFGQNLDPDVLEAAFNLASDCDLMLALGSTLVVEPAASLPRLAKRSGAKLVIINLSHTPLDAMADIKIEAPIGETLKKALKAID